MEITCGETETTNKSTNKEDTYIQCISHDLVRKTKTYILTYHLCVLEKGLGDLSLGLPLNPFPYQVQEVPES